jgi:hypothetical protein
MSSASSGVIDLMMRVVYQLRPRPAAELEACTGCDLLSPDGGKCAECLASDLGELLGDSSLAHSWLCALKAVATSEKQILECARSIDFRFEESN